MIPYTEARLVWVPAAIAGRSDRFAVVRSARPDFSDEHNATLARWDRSHGYWLGPGVCDASMELHGAAYERRLAELSVELTTDYGRHPDLVRSELSKIDVRVDRPSQPFDQITHS